MDGPRGAPPLEGRCRYQCDAAAGRCQPSKAERYGRGMARGDAEKGDKSNLPRSGPQGASHKLDLSPFPPTPPGGPARQRNGGRMQPGI